MLVAQAPQFISVCSVRPLATFAPPNQAFKPTASPRLNLGVRHRMKEGWLGDDYLILFTEEEGRLAAERYQLDRAMPGHVVIGLRGWDKLIVQDLRGDTHSVPTVPLDTKYSKPYALPGDTTLEAETRFVGRIKWYITPIVFGGDPSAGANLTWVTHEQHGELVVWWNAKYRELKESGRNA